MDLTTIVTSLTAGVLSSLLTMGILELLKRERDAKRFGSLAGSYAHYSMNGERLLDGVTDIVFRGGDVLSTHGRSSEGTWDGLIIMSRDLMGVGSGIYQYSDRMDCGTHHVQMAADGASCFVLVVNTSHGKNSTFSCMWRRIQPKR